MEPGSQSVRSPERANKGAADMIGVIIALLTLIVPLAVIAYYSGEPEPLPSTSYLRPPARSR